MKNPTDMNNNMIGKRLILVAVVLTIVLVIVHKQKVPKPKPAAPLPNTNDQSLADRLKTADAVCYGAKWCGFTKKQLAETQSLSDAYTYVDCESDKDRCNEVGINAYPTWVVNGKKHEGFMTTKRLSDIC